jgi:diadenosine tetraphosphatase ApaH/serine/threonine PP2A family protein phosphatase
MVIGLRVGGGREAAVPSAQDNSVRQEGEKPRGLGNRLARIFAGDARAAALPDGVRVYAVGDIHGCAAELDLLLAMIEADVAGWRGERHLVFVGDYVDRGPNSKGVVARLLHPPSGFTVRHLKGNHEQALLDFLDDPESYVAWRDFGARETLLSYGVTAPADDATAFAAARDRFRAALPKEHRAFFEALELSARIGDYFFVHAGVRPGIALEMQSAEDLLWVRDEFLASTADFGAVVVHGHTPTMAPVRRRNRIGIDTGAFATGRLTAAVLEGIDCRFLGT